MTYSLRTLLANADWNDPAWRGKEVAHVRALAEQAGWYAYVAPGWSASAIRKEALAFLRACPLLLAFQHDALVEGMVISRFLKGWRAHESAEARS